MRQFCFVEHSQWSRNKKPASFFIIVDITITVWYNELQKDMINLINLLQGDCLELMKVISI